jgi:hypothetical protein
MADPARAATIGAEMLPKLVPMLRRYVVGRISIVIYAATVAYVGFGLLFNVPAVGALAIVVGLLEMIPVIGPATSLVLVGSTAASQGTFAAILRILYALALRLSIDNLVGAIALGQAARVHPVVVIFSFVIGAMLFGIIGLLLAVPTAASIKLILQHYYAEPTAPDEAVELTSALAPPGRITRPEFLTGDRLPGVPRVAMRQRSRWRPRHDATARPRHCNWCTAGWAMERDHRRFWCPRWPHDACARSAACRAHGCNGDLAACGYLD